MSQSLHLAPFEHAHDLAQEMSLKGIHVLEQRGRLFLTEGAQHSLVWSQSSWPDVKAIPIRSISDAADQLKSLGRNWALYATGHYRRAELIQDLLPHYPKKPIPFLQPRPTSPMGGWTLWEPNLIMASSVTSSPYPLGEVHFIEDRLNPPSRAYLKLWEFFTCHSPRLPQAHAHLLDMGACPGGWTWVLSQLGSHVTAVDKAPLDPRIAQLPQVVFKEESAFGIDPKSLKPVDWFFSDIICYPVRLLELVKRWQEVGVKNFVCTLKFQGETDHATSTQFLKELGGTAIHQFHNKHEITWYRIEE